MNSTTYKNLIRPWRPLSLRMASPRGTYHYHMGYGTMALFAAIGLPIMLSVLISYYAAYVYWVMLVSLVFGTVWAARALFSLALSFLWSH